MPALSVQQSSKEDGFGTDASKSLSASWSPNSSMVSGRCPGAVPVAVAVAGAAFSVPLPDFHSLKFNCVVTGFLLHEGGFSDDQQNFFG